MPSKERTDEIIARLKEIRETLMEMTLRGEYSTKEFKALEKERERLYDELEQ
jgi:hypothetical protein